MSFLDLVQKRFSVRKYEDTPVEEEKLMKVLEAGRLAPSACNFQPWHFLVIREKANKEALAEVYGQSWFIQAPVIIGVFSDRDQAWIRRDGKCYVDVDAAIAMDHIVMQATELGLGTCWIGALNPDIAREVLQLPENIEPLLFTPLGYPACEAPTKKRKALDEIVHWERF